MLPLGMIINLASDRCGTGSAPQVWDPGTTTVAPFVSVYGSSETMIAWKLAVSHTISSHGFSEPGDLPIP